MAECLLGKHRKSDDRIERAIDKCGSEQGSCGHRRLGVGIGFPCVHRRKAGFRTVADQREYKAQAHRSRIKLVGDRDEQGPVEALARFDTNSLGGCEVGHDGAKERQRDADAADDDVFPRRFE